MSTIRDFIKKACLSGVCLCGFGNLIPNSVSAEILNLSESKDVKNKELSLAWIKELLVNLDKNLDESELRTIIKSASIAHHEELQMEEMLSSFKGKLNEFIKFIEEKWGWKISYQENKNILIADENKSVCVCPLLKKDREDKYPALCYCSEGFAERMFSFVYNKPVKAIVTSSIQKGDDSCIYHIFL